MVKAGEIKGCGKKLPTYENYNKWLTPTEAANFEGLWWAPSHSPDGEERPFQMAAPEYTGSILRECGSHLSHNTQYVCRQCLQEAGVIW